MKTLQWSSGRKYHYRLDGGLEIIFQPAGFVSSEKYLYTELAANDISALRFFLSPAHSENARTFSNNYFSPQKKCF